VCGAETLLMALFNAVYVGQATNLRQRFDDHWRQANAPDGSCSCMLQQHTRILVYHAGITEELCKVESVLIECLGPTANRQKGPGLKGKLEAGRPA